jgi:hypothetical protein
VTGDVGGSGAGAIVEGIISRVIERRNLRRGESAGEHRDFVNRAVYEIDLLPLRTRGR